MADVEEDHKCPSQGAPAWMATFGDLMSLLVTFFVLLLSFANMDVVKFKQAMGSVQDALGVQKKQIGSFAVKSASPIELSDHVATPFIDVTDVPSRMDSPTMDQRMMGEVQKVIAAQNLDKIVEATSDARGVVVKVKGHMLFDEGSDVLHPEAFIFLDEIANLARGFPYAIAVEGHTDDQPPARHSPYGTNWHLSSARAITALRYLVDVGGIDRRRLSAAGFSDTRPLYANDSPEHRAANRRVEFVYLRDKRLAIPKKPEKEWVPESLSEGAAPTLEF